MAMVISARSKALTGVLLLLLAGALVLLVGGASGWFRPHPAPPPPFPGEFSEFFAPRGPVGTQTRPTAGHFALL